MADLAFANVEEALTERERLVPEIQRLQNWLSGIATDERGLKVSSQDYQRKRGEVVTRLTQLQQRAGKVRVWLRKHNQPVGGHHPNVLLLADCYRALQAVESPEVEALLTRIEGLVPLTLLEGENNG